MKRIMVAINDEDCVNSVYVEFSPVEFLLVHKCLFDEYSRDILHPSDQLLLKDILDMLDLANAQEVEV